MTAPSVDSLLPTDALPTDSIPLAPTTSSLQQRLASIAQSRDAASAAAAERTATWQQEVSEVLHTLTAALAALAEQIGEVRDGQQQQLRQQEQTSREVGQAIAALREHIDDSLVTVVSSLLTGMGQA